MEIGIPKERILWVKPELELSLAPWLNVNTTRALHGHIEHSVYEYANMLDCGYRLQFNGRTIFQPEDSVLLHQHLDMGSVDLLFVSLMEHNTYLEGSIYLINAINPGKIFAQHFGTYEIDEDNSYWTVGLPDELCALLPLKLKDSFSIPKQGEIYYI